MPALPQRKKEIFCRPYQKGQMNEADGGGRWPVIIIGASLPLHRFTCLMLVLNGFVRVSNQIEDQ